MSTANHPRFDFARFAALYPLQHMRAQAAQRAFLRPAGQVVTSPFHLTTVELVRREVLGDSYPSRGASTDAFVFASGEPPAPYLTKIGGLPFRTRRKSWPVTSDGRPLAFVGQLSFVDSRDLTPDLPGDVLLVFADPENLLSVSAYQSEWVRLSETELVTTSDVPVVHYTWQPGPMAQKRGKQPEQRRFELAVCHGQIYRTCDLPEDEACFAGYDRPWSLSVLEATKIGGVPRAVQHVPTIAGRFVASIASVQPVPELSYPWANDPAPISLSCLRALPTWKFGDMGVLHFFDDHGKLGVDAQSY